MIISKRAIVLLGIGSIFFFALLNRIHIIQKSDSVNANVQVSERQYGMAYFVSFVYKGIQYDYRVEDTAAIENKTTCKLLIINENPEQFIIFNFLGFWFIALMIAVIITLAWLLYVQVFFEKVVSFKFLGWKRKNKEIDE